MFERMKPNERWTVRPHDKLVELAPNLHTVSGQFDMPLGQTTRRMTIARPANERLVIYSAISLDEPEMRKVEALGTVAYLVVPSAIHRMDIKPWKQRYPSAIVIAPVGAKRKVEEIVPVEQTEADFGDPRVTLSAVDGTGGKEAAMLVETERGTTLVVNDIIFNLPELRGFAKLAYTLLGFGPGHPHQPKLVKMRLVDDDKAMRAQLRTWAAIPGLERLLVAHGAAIDNARETLLALAAA